jgi:hypothetical protein
MLRARSGTEHARALAARLGYVLAKPRLSAAEAARPSELTYRCGFNNGTSAVFPTQSSYQFSPGLLLAGYWAPLARVHVGGFLSYAALGQGDLYGLGVTVKLGAVSVERVWVGVAFDVGAAFFDATGKGGANGSYTNTAIRLFPRVHLDLLLGTVERWRVAAFGAFGVDYSPVVGWNWDYGMRSMVTPSLLFGLNLGG